MIKQPKDIFETEEELKEYTKYWQDKLFLNDWIIVPKICEPIGFEEKNRMGENILDMVNKCCVIRILSHKYYGERIMKYCAEKTLVHELLHCKYNWVYNDNSYEGKYVDTIEHGLLEQMAKSLIMAKYDVGLGYFIENGE